MYIYKDNTVGKNALLVQYLKFFLIIRMHKNQIINKLYKFKKSLSFNEFSSLSDDIEMNTPNVPSKILLIAINIRYVQLTQHKFQNFGRVILSKSNN